jgi:hypothetical protein
LSGAAVIRRLLLVGVLTLVAVPAGASASPLGFPFDPLQELPSRLRAEVPSRLDPGRSPAPFHPVFVLESRHGYRVGVIGIGSAVVLEVVRKHGRAVTAYVARGTVTPNRLQASFGEFGKVAMRFRPSSNPPRQKPRRRCVGAGRFINRRGVYVGNVRFTGEGGYISVHAHRAKGQVSSVAPQCERGFTGQRSQRAIRPSRGDPLELDFLVASWRHAVTSTSVGAVALGGRAFFFASTEQSQGRLAVLRLAVTHGPSQAFAVDNALTRVQISPPAPFNGTGTYRAAADGSKTWSGPLTVNFPGAPRLPLTGPQFRAQLEASF